MSMYLRTLVWKCALVTPLEACLKAPLNTAWSSRATMTSLKSTVVSNLAHTNSGVNAPFLLLRSTLLLFKHIGSCGVLSSQSPTVCSKAILVTLPVSRPTLQWNASPRPDDIWYKTFDRLRATYGIPATLPTHVFVWLIQSLKIFLRILRVWNSGIELVRQFAFSQ